MMTSLREFGSRPDLIGLPVRHLGAPLASLTTAAQRSGGESGGRDLDLTKAIWTLPANFTKNGVAHVVPLVPAVVAILFRDLLWRR